ncbi:MAG: hypothetical protein ABIO24_11320 [Saprospiraceae bacterium]
MKEKWLGGYLQYLDPAAQRRRLLARLPGGIKRLDVAGRLLLQKGLLPPAVLLGKITGVTRITSPAETPEGTGQEKDTAENGSGNQAEKQDFSQGNQKDGGEEQAEKKSCGSHE